jgi:hypothetical protein
MKPYPIEDTKNAITNCNLAGTFFNTYGKIKEAGR